MAVTESGIVTLVNELQSKKAERLMAVVDFGMVTLLNELQQAKAQSPISVTVSGIVTVAKELQQLKASLAIRVPESGIVMPLMSIILPAAGTRWGRRPSIDRALSILSQIWPQKH